MFKKLKDKLAEEVKSSPQRIQQIAQAAQAAVTSASSSISDITNNDLFSIGDNDGQQNQSGKLITSSPKSITSAGPSDSLQTSIDSMDYMSGQDIMDNQRQRKLSNSSIASDVSFRFPSYESPSMYHLQSDMEISASEAEERGFASGSISLDRVTKEQIYAAYRRTQDRYKKYRTQYADLARHYKLLERENAKAKNVLVETQDKALRRISELREQCALEQSAKAHLEKVMRDEIDEKNIKIDTLDTKIKLLQSNENIAADNGATNAPLINLSVDNDSSEAKEIQLTSEMQALHTKIEKMEQLINKYKESFKTSKDKNSQLSSELKVISTELQSKNKENEDLKAASEKLVEARQKIQELNELNEDLQNKINVADFNKKKEISCLEIDFLNSQQELEKFRKQIEVYAKREEENAISLAENKLRIHKELESKEAEIKSLKDSLSESTKEIASLTIVINDYKHTVTGLKDENSKYNHKLSELDGMKNTISDLTSQLKELTLNCKQLENSKTKADEEYKCLQLQMKQETAEKLAMIDRNTYLENRNAQLQEEISKKSKQIVTLENNIQNIKTDTNLSETEERTKLTDEISMWKNKCHILESEMQEEREELGKLQTEIEKLLSNHELLQDQNTELNTSIADLKNINTELSRTLKAKDKKHKYVYEYFTCQIKDLKQIISSASNDAKLLKKVNNVPLIIDNLGLILQLHSMEMKKCQDSVSATEISKIASESTKTELKMHQEENEELKQEIKGREAKITQMEEECLTLSKEYENALNELTSLKIESQNTLEQVERSQNRLENLQEALEIETGRCLALEQETEKLTVQFQSVEEANESLKTEIEALKYAYDINILENNNIKMEKDTQIQSLQDKIQSVEEANRSLKTETEALKYACDNNILENNNIKMEKDTQIQSLLDKSLKLELERNKLDESLRCLKSENELLQSDIKTLKTKNKLDALENDNEKRIKELEEKVSVLEDEKNTLNNRLKSVDYENKELNAEVLNLKESSLAQNNSLQEQKQELDNKRFIIKELEESTTNIAQENTSLRMQCETITDSVNELESELDDLKKSHSKMESERERLSSIIDDLEKSRLGQDKEMQTEAIEDSEDLHSNEMKNKNNNKESCNTLQEENRRLQSDITGLQSYLAKISKENSILNDKLRDLMASSENCSEKIHALSLNEANTSKEKVEELLRENNLLMEENLELKDQLSSQNGAKPAVTTMTHNSDNDIEYKILSEKYNSTFDLCKKLEGRLSELEQMNRSITGNMKSVQDKNEKLRLTNEKLERRLDESLVSLRHLHSLQENTELEYLRNILYEYLTGSGSHSLTLAKVLAAVVKFDDLQTQQVLIKEKERQGLLRQLGII